MKLVYLKRYVDKEIWEEVSKDVALDTVLNTYADNDEVRGWLTEPGEIECRFAVIKVVEK